MMLLRNWKELGSIERASIVILIVLSVCIQASLANVSSVSGSEPVPLKAVQVDTYNDGAKCLRFEGTCNTTTVYIEIIQANGTVTPLNFPGSKYNISQANFCYPNSSTSKTQKRDLWGSIERHFYRRHEVTTTCSESKSRQTPTSHSEECTTTSSSQHSKECTTTTQHSEECTTTTSSQHSKECTTTSTSRHIEECTTTSPSRHSEECTTTSSSQHSEECATASSSQHGKECTATGSSQHGKECTATGSSRHASNCQHSHKHHSSKEHHPCGGVVHKTHTTEVGGGTNTHVTNSGNTGPGGTGTGRGQTGTGIGQTKTGTGIGPIETGTGMGHTGTGIGHTGTGIGQTGTGIGHTGTGIGQTGTGIGQTGTGIGQTGTGIGQTGTGVGHTGTGVGPIATGTGIGQTGTGIGQTGTGVGQTGTGIGQTGTGTGIAPIETGTGIGQTGTGIGQTGTGIGQTGTGIGPTGTGIGPTGTGTGIAPIETGTGIGQTGTGIGPTGTGTGIGQTGTGRGPTGTGTGIAPIETGTGIGQTGTGIGQTGTGIGQTGTGIGPTGTAPIETGTGIGQTGTGIGQTGTGIGQTGTGIGPTGTGTGIAPIETGTGIGQTGTGIGQTGTGIGQTGTGIGPTGTGIGQTETGTGPIETGQTGTGASGNRGTPTATGSGATVTGTATGTKTGTATGSTSGRKSTSTTQTTIPTGGVVIPNNQYSGNASAINIYAIRHNFVLITYFTDFPITRRISGLILSWGGDISSTIVFDSEKECTSSQIIKNVDENGFMRVCFNKTMKELDWTIYSSPDSGTGAVTLISQGTIENFTDFSNNTKIFSVEHNKYGVAQPTHTSGTWTIFIYWIDNQTHGPYNLYSLPDDNVTVFEIYQCNIAYQYLGYSCLVHTEQESRSVFIDLDFYSSGSLNGTHSFTIDQIPNDQTPFGAETLRYGGYLVLTKNDNTITGFATTNEGQNTTQWGLPTNTTYLPLTGCSDKNVVWALVNQNETTYKSWTISSSDSLSDFNKDAVGKYGTSTVVNTTPSINQTVQNGGPMNFTIQYSVPVKTSSGNMTIYYMNGTTKTPCFTAPANWGSVQNQNTYQMTVPNGVISQQNSSYYVEVDNGFVTDSSNDQSLPKMSNSWYFNTGDTASSGDNGSVSAIVLLIPEGTTLFVKKSIDRNTFVTNLRDDIARVIGCSSDRLSIPTKFQYKHDTPSDQIFLRVDINEAKSPTDTDASTLAGYLNDVIKYKNMTAISTGTAAQYLDSNNGAWRTTHLWNKYKWVLFSLFGLLFLFILWLWARSKHRRGRNLLAFVLWPLILVDFGLDIAFVATHGKDEKWLYPTSIVFLVVPVAFCILFTFWIIGRDLRENTRFSQWWRQHSQAALIFTIFSGIDNESLNVMSSRAAGYTAFNAPFSQVAIQRIFYTTIFIIIIEDFAQLIFLIIYQTVIIIPAIIPILVLASCILIILLKIICLIIYSRDDDDDDFSEDKPAVEESTINETVIATEQNNYSIGAGPISDSYAETGRETTGYNLPPMTQLESEHPRQQHLLNTPGRERIEEVTETKTIVTGGRHPTSFGSGRRFEETETETETIFTGGRHPISDERYITKEDVVFKNVSSGRKPVIENKGITGVSSTTETSGSIESSVITEESARRLHLPSSETRVINEGGVITRVTTTTDENGVTTITKEIEGPTEIIESYEASSRGDAIEGSSRGHLEGTGGRIARTTSDTNTDINTETTTDADGTTTITTTTTTTTTDSTSSIEGSRSGRK